MTTGLRRDQMRGFEQKPLVVTDYAQEFTAGSLTTISDSDTWTQVATLSKTPVRPCLAFINASASLRNESLLTGEFSWSARIQVDGADHPIHVEAARSEGRIQVPLGLTDETDRLELTVPWSLTASAHTIDLDFLITTVSAGDVLVRNAKLSLFLLEA